MAEAKPTLDALRAEIDAIDDQLHRLIMQRAQVALSIGALKNSHGPEAGFMRPSREARLLRRLAAKEDGPLPKAVVIRLWREIIAGVLRLQGPFSLAVYAPEGANGYWDLARDHFGSLTPATAHDSPQQVLNAVTAGRASVGHIAAARRGRSAALVAHDAGQGSEAPPDRGPASFRFGRYRPRRADRGPGRGAMSPGGDRPGP